MNKWMELAAKCEAATKPDRGIDRDISKSTGDGASLTPYTASLDAITALIERELPGWEWQANGHKRLLKKTLSWVHDGWDDSPLFKGYAVNPALALCAAFCRAMAAKSPEEIPEAASADCK